MTTRRKLRRWGLIAGLAAIVAGLLFWPTGRYVEVPGSAESLKPFVRMAGRKDRAEGSYMLTTVGIVGPASPAMLLWGKLQPYSEIEPATALMGDASAAEYDQLQKYDIKAAADNATAAAFAAAHKPYQITNHGIYVMSVLKASPFRGKLALGDTITQLDGHTYSTADAYVAAIKHRPVGSTIKLTYLHAGRVKHVAAKLIRLPGTKRAGIGITLTAHTSVKTQPKVTIDAGDIGGPSAGLMFAIQTYTQLTGSDYRHGDKIAGTGTIAADGSVGQIGGIDKKVYIANKRGAAVFFAPNTPATPAILKADPDYQNNYAVAKKTAAQLHSKMKVVPVATLQDALTYLRQR